MIHTKGIVMIKKKYAFTLLEMIMVIVVLGIVSSIGATAIADVYSQYLMQRAVSRASAKTELAAQQIANRLSHRMPGTTLARNPDNLSDNLLVTEGTTGSDYIHTMLEWIGIDNDSFSTSLLPGWNGFCDVNASTQGYFTTPGSKLLLANTIINNLSGGQVSMAAGAQNPAVFFSDYQLRYTYEDAPAGLPKILYSAKQCMGMVDTNRSCISSVSRNGDERLTFQRGAGTSNKLISEHYKLAWSAYAICPTGDGINGQTFDLVLYYNYQPWEGERLSGNRCQYQTGEHATLVRNVTVFKFAEYGNTFRFKLCTQETVGGDHNITICKEKAVLL